MKEINEELIDAIESGKYSVVPKWLGIFHYINPIALVTLVFYVGVKTNDIESRIFETPQQKEETLHHLEDANLHMSFERKMDLFVPRREIEYKLNTIQSNQKKIMDKLNIN